jgi:light-harvesting complex I chlorophyll a/b binding protein 3
MRARAHRNARRHVGRACSPHSDTSTAPLRRVQIINGRWAMLGAAGCVAPEVLGSLGVIPDATNILWWKTSVFPPAGTTDIYWADPWAIFWIEVVLMQFAELRRWQDYRKPGSMGKQFFLGFEQVLQGSGEPAYPGALPWPTACVSAACREH